MDFDSIVIGAGIAGTVIAERLANYKQETVLLIEKRNHIGGNCYDLHDENNILVHPYGPHIFHTDHKDVWDYLSQFTEWHYYQHKVLAMIDGKPIPIPFNLNTLHALFPTHLASLVEDKLISHFGFDTTITITDLEKVNDKELNQLSFVINGKIFEHYTIKQWGVRKESISRDIFDRLPIRISYDDRYFSDKYQGLPLYGYTRMFNSMLSNKRIKRLLNTAMREVIQIDFKTGEINLFGSPFHGKIYYTGMIDELLNYQFGSLPYRAIDFRHERLNCKQYQINAVINYPNNYDFTRITEFKQLTGQEHHLTSILREYPCDYSISGDNEVCYPIINKQNTELFQKYFDALKRIKNFLLIGRLAEFKYYDMDDMVKAALSLFS